MGPISEQRYDAVAYVGGAFAQTHPDALAAFGTLCGLDPAPVQAARILEFGCGDGGNLIPLAYAMPGARFLGFDLSRNAIARGQAMVDALGLANIELRHQDVMEFDPAEGPFDYAIAHGLYSWVPENVRERLLALCRAVLAPHGVAFISYNALPGGYLIEMMRQMMLHHAGAIEDKSRQVAAARAFADELVRLSAPKTAEQFILLNEANVLRNKPDHLLVHDELAPIVHREWKWSFAAATRRHGLRVIGEAGWSPVQERSARPEMRAWLDGLSPDPDIQAQYQDFLTLRRFREDILCRDDAPATCAPEAARLMRVRFRSSLGPAASEPDLTPGVAVEFKSDFGAALAIDGALTKAALVQLGRAYPASLSFNELFERVSVHATSAPDQERERLAQFLFLTIEPRLVEITTFDPPFARRDTDRPLASRVARLQREAGPRVTNLLHQPGEFAGERSARLLALLDGTRDRATLARALDQSEEAMERELAFLHRNGFLVEAGREPEGR